MLRKTKPLILLFLTLSLFLLLSCILTIIYMPSPYRIITLCLLITSMVLWSYASARTLTFCRSLHALFKHLLSGDYKTGVPQHSHRQDEFSRIEKLANTFSEQLIIYDKLRADRVSIYSRALSALLNRSSEALIAADIQQKNFRLNPATRNLLGVDREIYPAQTLLAAPDNHEFRTLFETAVSIRKVKTTGRCPLLIPGMPAPRQLAFTIIPFRSSDTSVAYAIIELHD